MEKDCQTGGLMLERLCQSGNVGLFIGSIIFLAYTIFIICYIVQPDFWKGYRNAKFYDKMFKRYTRKLKQLKKK